MSEVGASPETTLLKNLVRERRLTVEEALVKLHRRAESRGENGFALSERQFRRWLGGDVTSLSGARPVNIRVVEAEFGHSIETLLSLDIRHVTSYGTNQSVESPENIELRTHEFFNWVINHSGICFEDGFGIISGEKQRILSVTPGERASNAFVRSRIGRAEVASAIADYYGGTDLYEIRVGESLLATSIYTKPSWIGLSVPLGGEREKCSAPRFEGEMQTRLSDYQAECALKRLASIELSETVLVNNPLYRLTEINLDSSSIQASFECSEFASYSMTSDLLESELIASIEGGNRASKKNNCQLRDAWLSNYEAALSFDKRNCVGGTAGLVAISDGNQYQLLIQERSDRVLNAAGTLAVIPKAFHQPITDPYSEVRISTTLEREMEEELFGRPDLEQLTSDSKRQAAPLHPLNCSEPMGWLKAHPEAWQMECTGFGINMVSGNFEFASLIVIHDSTWWTNYGHMLEANWETQRLRRYSSHDADGLANLVNDPGWNNEGLFAFMEGVQRLSQISPGKIDLPRIGVNK
ncbi:MAG: hypothetical protein HKL80_05605 [Acidimicrobiales bacterium]|nr:hypothetical protein [Acidimicrobiales bacterium]